MRAIVAGVFLALCALPAAAEQADVAGAFGFEFGQVVDTAQLKPLGTEAEGGVKYGFIPGNPYAPLTEYELALTPRSLRVYRITARGTFTSFNRCREELVQLEQSLDRKYVKTSGKIATGFGEKLEITFGRSAHKIRGICTGKILQKTLTLTYLDEDLAQAARDEATPTAGATGAVQDGGGPARDESGL